MLSNCCVLPPSLAATGCSHECSTSLTRSRTRPTSRCTRSTPPRYDLLQSGCNSLFCIHHRGQRGFRWRDSRLNHHHIETSRHPVHRVITMMICVSPPHFTVPDVGPWPVWRRRWRSCCTCVGSTSRSARWGLRGMTSYPRSTSRRSAHSRYTQPRSTGGRGSAGFESSESGNQSVVCQTVLNMPLPLLCRMTSQHRTSPTSKR